MANNQKPTIKRTTHIAGPPQQFDISAPIRKQRETFPAIGASLNTYQNTTASAPRRPEYAAASSPGRMRRLFQVITPKRAILIIIVFVVLVGGFVGFKFVYNAHRLFGGSVFHALTVSKLKGESSGRVNILLAGNSADDVGHQGGTLTDSIIILSIDTKDNSAFMLSVPRDLYVAIPGNGHQKINAVYPDGESDKFSEDGYPDGGMGLLENVISRDFGITPNYYALVNYNALRDAVNSVGGVDINIQSTDKRGLYDPSKDYVTKGPLVKLTNGIHHLNGEQALDLSRARGDAYGSYGFAGSDFDRTNHQRQLILALRAKATTAGVLANPIKISKLFDAIGSNVKTDLTLSDVRRLYDVTKGISGNGIQSIGLNNVNGQNLLMNYRAPSGESALVPAAGADNYDAIQQYIQQITSTDPLVREAAKITILNGTATSGLAAKASYNLTKQNIAVSSVGDADTSAHTTTQIIAVTSGKPATQKALQQSFSGSTVTTVNPYGTKYGTDFIVVLGSDYAASLKSTATN